MPFLQTLEDAARVGMSGLMMGADHWANEANQQSYDAARQRLGRAGDVIDAATWVPAAVGGFGALKGGVAAARSLPQLARAVANSGVKDAVKYAGMGARNAIRGRLDLEPLANPVWRAAAAHPKTAAAMAVATPVGAAISGGNRMSKPTMDNVMVATPAKTPTAAPSAAPKASGKPQWDLPFLSQDTVEAYSAKAGVPSFADMAAAIANGNNGNITIGDLSALADIANKTAVKDGVLKPRDQAFAEFKQSIDDDAMAKQMQAAQLIQQGRVKEGTELGRSAVMERRAKLGQMLGVDPYQLAIAQQQQDQEDGN
jgi:hypothetical protein